MNRACVEVHVSPNESANFTEAERTVLDYATDAGILGSNPARTLGRSKPKQSNLAARILGEGELDALLDACENFPWLRDVIRMTLYESRIRLVPSLICPPCMSLCASKLSQPLSSARLMSRTFMRPNLGRRCTRTCWS